MADQAFTIDDADALPKPKSRLRALLAHWYDEHRRSLLCTLLVGILIFLYFAPSIVVFIPAGHGGVLWKRFHEGTQMAPALPEGVHVIFPWDKIEIYDLRLQEDTRSYSAIANDGLNVSIEITVRYRPYAEMLAALHKNVGPRYLEVLLVPEVGSVSREIVSRFKADELYAHRRLRVQTETYEQVADRVMYAQLIGAENVPKPDGRTKTGYLLIQDILIRNVSLPEAIMASIERKIQQDQAAQEYQFRLQRELFESQRKQLEGQGIRAFQETVQANLTENYLRWRGIEATLELAHSPNAKIVVIGNAASGGLPLILDAASGQNSLPAPGTPTATPGAPPAGPTAKLTSVPTSTAVPPVSQLPSLSGEGSPGQTPIGQMPSLNTGGESAPATGHPTAPAPAAKPEPAKDGAKDGSKTAASAPILSKVSPSKLLDMIQSK
ncbi:regulator of protease activity HflC (stomatin/prohibitin superfamily) [Azospirillum lipoferum]|uniref:Membrane protease subunit stomatin/prohibitin-like protein n=1 Tax=Azospirillum lipoferum TaxID=193 RepID=A0A5A9GQT9_AZOLI|nr:MULTISPECIES: prohibitin family protein [Azospirillum]KAA0596172.1 membrane protease subunit stomatin/prohibitin-like protein [Azospirillum lipoferum]MCP1611130.1 regulator of protease activity HflC (stomatin/prohibitin superfamily) [Azospirillum lipoferum]MDW5533745.1 SPFH domain-containing protein [Azospirillum sp. NL1]